MSTPKNRTLYASLLRKRTQHVRLGHNSLLVHSFPLRGLPSAPGRVLDSSLLVLPVLFSDHPLEDLSGRALRKLLNKLDRLGLLIASDGLLAEINNFFFSGLHPIFQHHKSLDRFSPVVIGHS